ncbi:chitinase [Kitasatospora sp. LaBMicrA B282]|uniref:chitinase n=1 Tax=Kitasatospora sp. LaBMicrA B282 TaxID=3420949 RepID=UPI003D101EBA
MRCRRPAARRGPPPRPPLALLLAATALVAFCATPAAGHPPATTALPLPSPPPGPDPFPARFSAPYVESWGPPDVLQAARQATGLAYFTIGFVVDDGSCAPEFGGDVPLTAPAWTAAIAELRAHGGDVIASLGGGGGREPALSCRSSDALTAAYRRVVDTLGLRRLDFDVEGKALQDSRSIDLRNAALAELQHEYAALGRPLAVQYTLPSNPWGLSDDGLRLLRNARAHGVAVDLVNAMTMDYGPDLAMGDAAVRAAGDLEQQLAVIWPERTDAQLWAMTGNTPMIGTNDAVNEVFTEQDARQLAAFADEKGIRLLSYWSLGRDHPCATGEKSPTTCTGVSQQPWAFTRILGRQQPS